VQKLRQDCKEIRPLRAMELTARNNYQGRGKTVLLIDFGNMVKKAIPRIRSPSLPPLNPGFYPNIFAHVSGARECSSTFFRVLASCIFLSFRFKRVCEKFLTVGRASYSFESDAYLFGATYAHSVSTCSDAMSRKREWKYCLSSPTNAHTSALYAWDHDRVSVGYSFDCARL